MKLESDKKLEKLESFLGRLNSKGECEKKYVMNFRDVTFSPISTLFSLFLMFLYIS